MIKAEDLRIGVNTKQGKVVSFWESGIHVGMGKTYKFSELEPIPLTPEELVKLGFEKFNTYKNGSTEYLIDNSDPSKRICVRVNTSVLSDELTYTLFNYSSCDNASLQFIMKVEYVHALQNACAMISEELNYTP
jgi:hypothetical protein